MWCTQRAVVSGEMLSILILFCCEWRGCNLSYLGGVSVECQGRCRGLSETRDAWLVYTICDSATARKSVSPEMLHQLIRKDLLKLGKHCGGDGVSIAPPRFSQVKKLLLYTPSRLRGGHTTILVLLTSINMHANAADLKLKLIWGYWTLTSEFLANEDVWPMA